jgi:hypothetical protein
MALLHFLRCLEVPLAEQKLHYDGEELILVGQSLVKA